MWLHRSVQLPNVRPIAYAPRIQISLFRIPRVQRLRGSGAPMFLRYRFPAAGSGQAEVTEKVPASNGVNSDHHHALSHQLTVVNRPGTTSCICRCPYINNSTNPPIPSCCFRRRPKSVPPLSVKDLKEINVGLVSG